jgi:hypothetical protein
VVPPGGRVEVTAAFDTAGLARGDHLSDLLVLSNDPDEPEVVVRSRLRSRQSVPPRRR